MILHRHCERLQGAKQSDAQCRCERSEAICRSFSQNGWIASVPFASLWASTHSLPRKDTLFHALVLVFLLGALSGCAPWVMVEGPYRMDSQGYEVSLPAGWRRATTVGDSLLVTRDGVSLQNIRVERVAIGDELKHRKKKFAKGMLPQDVAALELDEVRSDQAVRNFALVENIPFQVTGFPGFKLVYTFKTGNGLRLRRIHYGVLLRDWVYRIQYQAAAKYYFDKDLAAFERVRESFKVTERP